MYYLVLCHLRNAKEKSLLDDYLYAQIKDKSSIKAVFPKPDEAFYAHVIRLVTKDDTERQEKINENKQNREKQKKNEHIFTEDKQISKRERCSKSATKIVNDDDQEVADESKNKKQKSKKEKKIYPLIEFVKELYNGSCDRNKKHIINRNYMTNLINSLSVEMPTNAINHLIENFPIRYRKYYKAKTKKLNKDIYNDLGKLSYDGSDPYLSFYYGIINSKKRDDEYFTDNMV